MTLDTRLMCEWAALLRGVSAAGENLVLDMRARWLFQAGKWSRIHPNGKRLAPTPMWPPQHPFTQIRSYPNMDTSEKWLFMSVARTAPMASFRSDFLSCGGISARKSNEGSLRRAKAAACGSERECGRQYCEWGEAEAGVKHVAGGVQELRNSSFSTAHQVVVLHRGLVVVPDRQVIA